jgi:hypothetical protein
LKFFWALIEKLGGQIFDHQIWQPNATKIFWLLRMAIESD